MKSDGINWKLIIMTGLVSCPLFFIWDLVFYSLLAIIGIGLKLGNGSVFQKVLAYCVPYIFYFLLGIFVARKTRDYKLFGSFLTGFIALSPILIAQFMRHALRFDVRFFVSYGILPLISLLGAFTFVLFRSSGE